MAKSFKADIEKELSSNPAENIITTAQPMAAEKPAPVEEALGQAPVKAPKGYKLDPRFVEVKSKRIQLLIQPSVYAKLAAQAKRERISFNELCNKLFRAACED